MDKSSKLYFEGYIEPLRKKKSKPEVLQIKILFLILVLSVIIWLVSGYFFGFILFMIILFSLVGIKILINIFELFKNPKFLGTESKTKFKILKVENSYNLILFENGQETKFSFPFKYTNWVTDDTFKQEDTAIYIKSLLIKFDDGTELGIRKDFLSKYKFEVGWSKADGYIKRGENIYYSNKINEIVDGIKKMEIDYNNANIPQDKSSSEPKKKLDIKTDLKITYLSIFALELLQVGKTYSEINETLLKKEIATEGELKLILNQISLFKKEGINFKEQIKKCNEREYEKTKEIKFPKIVLQKIISMESAETIKGNPAIQKLFQDFGEHLIISKLSRYFRILKSINQSKKEGITKSKIYEDLRNKGYQIEELEKLIST